MSYNYYTGIEIQDVYGSRFFEELQASCLSVVNSLESSFLA